MRLIDADALWMVTEGDHQYYEKFEIENAPTVDAVPLEDYKSMERTVNKLTKAIADAVEVVRCKDCKWYEESKKPEMRSLRFCYRLKNDNGIPVGYNWDGNDFCSHGERREDV